nr:uncharacterized protein LOC113805543 [Penaeus vannamei]
MTTTTPHNHWPLSDAATTSPYCGPPNYRSLANSVTTKTYRPLKQSSIIPFGNWLVHHPWTVLTVHEFERKWKHYVASITSAYHHFFPEKKLRKHCGDLPWITDRIKRLMNQRDHAHRTSNTALYKSLRNKVIREIKLAKANFYPSKLHHMKLIKAWNGKMKELCGLNKAPRSFPCINHLSGHDAANEVNTVAICQRLPSLDATQLPAYLPMRTTAPEFAPELIKPLTSIINASLQQTKTPSDWKTSYVTAVPKTPSPEAVDETRPVSITSMPSLLCESFVSEWAYADLHPNFDQQQDGNIRSTSTSHYLISLVDYIYTNLEKRETSVVATLIDFSKAFDLVDHTTVVRKASAIGLLLINDTLRDTPSRWKYVDDSTIAATVNNTSPGYQPSRYLKQPARLDKC